MPLDRQSDRLANLAHWDNDRASISDAIAWRDSDRSRLRTEVERLSGERDEIRQQLEGAVEALRTARKDLTDPDTGKALYGQLAARMRIDDALATIGGR